MHMVLPTSCRLSGMSPTCGTISFRLGSICAAQAMHQLFGPYRAFTAPSPDKLARIAEVLGISLADIYSHAGYAVPGDLPGFHAYLPARYQDLPESALRELIDLFDSLVERHGLTSPPDPAPGDGAEAVEAAP